MEKCNFKYENKKIIKIYFKYQKLITKNQIFLKINYGNIETFAKLLKM